MASDNPAIVQLGFGAKTSRYLRELSRVDLEAAVLALETIRYEVTRGRLPACLGEIRPPAVRASPHGSRWLLRPLSSPHLSHRLRPWQSGWSVLGL